MRGVFWEIRFVVVAPAAHLVELLLSPAGAFEVELRGTLQLGGEKILEVVRGVSSGVVHEMDGESLFIVAGENLHPDFLGPLATQSVHSPVTREDDVTSLRGFLYAAHDNCAILPMRCNAEVKFRIVVLTSVAVVGFQLS
jgi:hypothetical protein